MTELYGGGYATAEAPHADADQARSDEQTEGEAASRTVEASGETLTRDEYADLSGQETIGEAEAPESIDEADLAIIDAYDQTNGETREPLTRDEYNEQAEQASAPDDGGTHARIEEPDLAAIDAYDSESLRPPEEDHDEELGGTFTQYANHEVASQQTEEASDDGAAESEHVPSREADAERISTLEAENAELRQQFAEMRASNDTRWDRFEQQFADLAGHSGRSESSERASDEPSPDLEPRAASDARPDKIGLDAETQSAERIAGRLRDVDDSPGETTAHQHKRRLPSDTRLGFGGAVAGVALSTAAERLSPGAAQMLAYVGDALSLSIGAIAVWRENRKHSDARRPEN